MDTTTSPIVSRAEFENWSDEDIVERVFTGEPGDHCQKRNSASDNEET